MKKSIKLKIAGCITLLVVLISAIVFAESNNMIILKEDIEVSGTTNTQYLIYMPEELDKEFIFAFGAEDALEESLVFKTRGTSDEKSVAFIDSTNEGTLNQSGDTYIFVKEKISDTEYGTMNKVGKIDLNDAFYKEFVEGTTKRISVDTTKSNTSISTIDGVKTEVTKGKVVITDSEEANYSYIIVKLPTDSENDYTKLMNLAEKISNKEELDELTLIEKLEIMNEFNILYKELEPTARDSAWQEVENMEILQPQDSKNGEKYIVFIKSENENEVVTDAQFLTCYDKYNPLYEKEMVVKKETTKLPVTVDNMIPYVITLAVIILAIILVLVIRKVVNKKEENK